VNSNSTELKKASNEDVAMADSASCESYSASVTPTGSSNMQVILSIHKKYTYIINFCLFYIDEQCSWGQFINAGGRDACRSRA
jgi:hypothetical protein